MKPTANLIIISCLLVSLSMATLQAQEPNTAMVEGPFGQGLNEAKTITKTDKCLHEDHRQLIKANLKKNQERLIKLGKINQNLVYRKSGVKLQWPLRQSAEFNDPGYYIVANYIDQKYPNQKEDYQYSAMTYDTGNGQNYQGLDITLWPYHWHMVDNDQVEVVAAAAGIILGKEDGNYDRNCTLNSKQWNAIYIQHIDGSVAWYGHMKRKSLSKKAIGSYVEAGEYLGVVASSGNSTSPHLHFEVYNKEGKLIDPYSGPTNEANGNTAYWKDPKPYIEPRINKLMTHYAAPNPYNNRCNKVSTFEQASFNKGDRVYIAAYYVNQLKEDQTYWRVYRPDNSLYASWIHKSPESYSYNSYWYYYIDLPSNTAAGEWKIEIQYKGKTYSHNFNVKTPNEKPDLVGSNKGMLQVDGMNVSIPNFRIHNKGAKAAEAFKIGYFISPNSTISGSDILLGVSTINGLAAGATEYASLGVVDLSSLELNAGSYYIGAIIDYDNKIVETNESNNNECFWTTPKIVITPNSSYCACSSPLTDFFCDDFDNYELGDLSSQSPYWRTWSGLQNIEEEGMVAENQTNKYLSMYKGGEQDIVLRLGDRTSGKYKLSFQIWLFAGNKGYFNILHKFNPGGYNDDEWAQEVFFDGNGVGRLRAGNRFISFGYDHDKWVPVSIHFDLDNNTSTLYIEGQKVKTWPFTYQSWATYGTKQLSGLNFYPINDNYEFYVDGIIFQKVDNFNRVNQSNEILSSTQLPVPFNESIESWSLSNTSSKLKGFKIFPSPTNGQFRLALDLDKSYAVTIEVLDPGGRVIKRSIESQTDRIRKDFDLSDYPNGLYLVRIALPKEILTKQLTLQR